MNDDIDHRENEFQRWVHALSHDMGAPLRAVVQFSLLLSRKMDSELDEKERYWLQLIHENGAVGQKMIEGLLTYSRLLTQYESQNEVVSLRDAFSHAEKRVSAIVEVSKANVDFDALGGELRGNATLWQQYFFQILDNAIKFHNKSKDLEIRISSIQTTDSISIRIEDSGIGVDSSTYDDITLPFKRLLSSTEYPGMGMGLCYCKRIVELHGGEMLFQPSSLGGLAVISTIKV